MLARDIMTKDVISVRPDLPVEEVGDLLIRYRIHGAPVTDEADQLIGMVSFVDLVGRVGDTAGEVMTPDPVCGEEDMPVEELAGLMLENQVRRIPIIRGGRVVGIVSASDVINVFVNLHERTGEAASGVKAENRRVAAVRKSGRRATTQTTTRRKPRGSR